MSQTKNYKLPIEKTIVKTYKKVKIQNRLTHTYECKLNTRLFNSTRDSTPNKISIILYQKIQYFHSKKLKKYIEKIAKDELGYVGDGERIFINVAGE